ncbi:MAG TPA: TerB family tellurite resistance protein [Spongiibacteraceae bacterium]|nr:TerB family tellurite resistance protein [Spongiibacteraceae bacterium]
MLQKFKALFAALDTDHTPSERDLQLASAALLIEISKADHQRDIREEEAIVAAIHTTYRLDKAEIDELLKEAKLASANAPSLYDFTRVINERCSEEHKYVLVRECWRVAFADGNIDKYEDHMIRKIADLIYLPHSLYIKAKLEVAGQI